MSKVIIWIFVGLSGVFIYSIGGTIEGRMLPVMSRLQISDPEPFPPPAYRTRWRGTATKYRNCSFVRVEWNLGPRNGNHVQIQFAFTDPPEIRFAGEFEWQDVLISLEPESVLQNSHADILHQCRFRPWLTRTRFFDAVPA